MINTKVLALATVLLSIQLTACNEGQKDKSNYYTEGDYASVEKYDSHVHINTTNPWFIVHAREDNFRLLDLNVEAPGLPSVEEQRGFSIANVKAFPGELAFVTTFDVNNWSDSNWQAKTLLYLKESFDLGAIGVKVWKNIGMDIKDKDGKFLMIDNPRFDTVIDFIQKNNKTLVGHLGEPKNCWLPLDKMTVKNDRNYFTGHPQYHMFLHPEYPTYENQVDARDHMLEKHPGLRFCGAHLGSLEWSFDELAKRLDKFPDMAVDMAERISHLQYLTTLDHQKAVDFFMKYQDRLIYATDMSASDDMDSTAKAKEYHDVRVAHWKYFTSDETMTAPELENSFKALHLPKDVVDKIYRRNFEKWFPGYPRK